MDGYALGKDIQEIKDRLAALEGRGHKRCGCGGGAAGGNVRLPRDARAWLDAGPCTTEEGAADGRVVLRSATGVRVEVSRADAAEVQGRTLLRNGAKVRNFRRLNPAARPAASCPDFDGPGCHFSYTTCVVFVLICHSCCYDDNGVFTGDEESEVCGVCVGG